MVAEIAGPQTVKLRCKLVIFDFDGTLADSFPWFARVINQIAVKYHLPKIDEDEIWTLRKFDARKIVTQIGVPWWAVLMLANQVRKMMTRDIRQISLFAGTGRMLRRLSEKGVLLAIVSSNSGRNVRMVLGPENAAAIKYYECGVSIFGKQAKLRKILRQSRVCRQEAIYIGDEIRDGEAARNERIPFGAVSWGYTRPEALRACAPDLFFETIEEIPESVA